MSSRPRAPQTAHLRSKFQRGIQKNPPPKVQKAIIVPHSQFADTDITTWIKLPEDITGTAELSLGDPFPIQNVLSQQEDDLCELLAQLCQQFRNQKRPYVAMAASAAIALIREGRQDDINPGLWPHIKRMEEELAQRTECADIDVTTGKRKR